jgi:hypothetical protein
MGTARLAATSRESAEIQFSPGLTSTPGSGGSWSLKATAIGVSINVPTDRPLPDRVLAKLYAQGEDGKRTEFLLVLEAGEQRSYSGQLDRDIVIRSGSHGMIFPQQQAVELVLVRNEHEEFLVDPINWTTRFQIDLYLAHVASGSY